MEMFCSIVYQFLMLMVINCKHSFSSSEVDIVLDDNLGFVWTQGSDVGNQHSVTCTDCTAVFDKNLEGSTNNRRLYPGGRAETACWCDVHGNLWMFGGTGYDDLPSEEPRLLNDLWLFNCTDQSWKMVEQETQGADKRLLPIMDQKKIPKRRRQAASCGVIGLIFIIFGGMDDEGNALSDTWLFDIVTSKWLPLYANHHGQNLSLSIHPPARHDMASWCLDDQLVIFGGHGQYAKLDDMWSFSLRSLTWSQVEQFSQTKDLAGEQETLFPPPMVGPATWTGLNKTISLFSYDCGGNSSTVHDVWEFFLETGNWKMTSMASRPGCLNESTDSEGYLNVHQHSAAWATPSNNIFIFGGQNLHSCGLEAADLEETSHLLVFNWTSMCWNKFTQRLKDVSGDLSTSQHFSRKALPSARAKMTFWQHQEALYVFGGVGYDGRGSIGFLNDLWIGNQRNVNTLLQTTIVAMKMGTMSPPKLFMIVLSAVGGTALLFGSSFCLRRINCRRRKRRRKAYDVHYSPLSNEVEFE